MNAKLSKTLTKLIALLIILTLMPSGLGLATSGARPEAAVPFEDESTSSEESQVTFLLTRAMALPSGSVFQNGGDRLADLQNNDGGWDWPLDDGNPANSSPPNTVGPIGRGLAEAYVFTSDPDHLAALQDAGTFLLAKTNNFSPSDGYLAAALDAIFGGTTYVDHVTTYFYDPLANGTYDRNGAGTPYDTAGYVNLIRTSRSGAIANLAAWDIGMGLVGAAEAGADTTAWIAGVKAEIDELNGAGWYDVIGLAGAIYGLAFVGEDHDPTAGEHASAASLADLGTILAGYQLASGGFTWNSGYLGAGNETVQETAYSILALNELDRMTYLSAIQSAADYLESVQLATGGWKNWAGGAENNEITGEALWGIATAYPLNHPPTAEANGPYLVAVEQSVALDSSGSYDPDGDSLSESWLETGAPTLGSITGSTFTAGTEAGITEVTLTVDDGKGGTATDTAMVVVFDPAGGFVTGGGWFDSPAGAYNGSGSVIRVDGNPDDGWAFNAEPPFVTPADFSGAEASIGSGSIHVAPITNSGGNAEKFILRYVPENTEILLSDFNSFSIDFLIDPAGTNYSANQFYINFYTLTPDPGDGGWYDCRFDYVATAGSTTNWTTLGFTGSTNATAVGDKLGGACPSSPDGMPAGSTLLFISVNLGDTSGVDTGVGGYFDNAQLTVSNSTTVWDFEQPLTGSATFGFVSKYKKGANVPTGNTEFQFKAGDLHFHSTSYEWLVVTGSNFAKFKGEGTINGAGNYKFQVWAGDDSPDTFRIKIWDAVTGAVVYDNGMDQAIGGGNIVVHNKK